MNNPFATPLRRQTEERFLDAYAELEGISFNRPRGTVDVHGGDA
jgi:hypothetical protein